MVFKVYICLFKVYRGVQGVLGSFTFILTVFKVYISSIMYFWVLASTGRPESHSFHLSVSLPEFFILSNVKAENTSFYCIADFGLY